MSTKQKDALKKEAEDKKVKKCAKKQAKEDKKLEKKNMKAEKKAAKKANKKGNKEETVALAAEAAEKKGFFKKLKDKLYIKNPKLRVTAIVLAAVILVGGVTGGIIGGLQYKKNNEWRVKTCAQLAEISDKIDTVTVMYGGVPINETALEKIQRQLDTIIRLLGGDVKYTNSTTVEQVEEQLTELEEMITEATGETEQTENTASNENTASSNTSTTNKSNVPSSKAEIIAYCNTALNKVKSQKAGYTKNFHRVIEGDAAGLPDWLTSLAEGKEQVTYKKGQDNSNDFPASGYSWSSKLTEKDVDKATIDVSGDIYKIKLTIIKEDNPTKGDTSHHGRCMSVMVCDEVKAKTSVVKDVVMHYHDSYVYAEIDSKTGNVTKAELCACVDLDLDIAVFGKVTVTNIVSKDTFTNFVW